VEKAQRKKEDRLKRQIQQVKKQRNRRILVWGVAIAFAALIAILAIFWPKPAPIALGYDKIPTLGPSDAKVKITEYGDFKCPACAFFSQSIMPQIKADYVDTGKASFSYQNFLIISPQQDSLTAALAAQSVYHQKPEEFWKFYDAVFKNQQEEHSIWATPDHLVELARSSGVNVDLDKLRQDIDNQTYLDEVNSQQQVAVKNNFGSTPTVLINGRKLDPKTALDYDKLKAEIEKALQETAG
jgi:protein-disulfide isomerase